MAILALLVLAACSLVNAGTPPQQAGSPPAGAGLSGVLGQGQASALPSTTHSPQPSAPPAPTQTVSVSPTFTPTVPTGTPTPDTRLNPIRWDQWPVLPTVSGAAKEIYRRGLAQGNDPHSYSTIGDCQSEPDVFLGIYATSR